MKMFSLLLAVLATAILVGSVAAQEAEESTKDFMEFAMYGGGSMPMGGISDWSVTSPQTGTEKLGAEFGYSFGVDVGHFLTPDLVVGLTLGFAKYGVDADIAAAAAMNHQMISPAAYLKKYFQGESNFLPYLKGQVGVDVVKFTTRVVDPNAGGYEYREMSYHPALAFGIGGGVLYYTFDYGGIFAEANYHMALSSDVNSTYEGRDYTFGKNASVFDLHAGIKVFFGGE